MDALDQTFRPRQDLVTGPLPVAPNRHSYWLRRRHHLLYWNMVSQVYESGEPVEVGALERAASAVSRHHDGVRLQLRDAGPDMSEWIVPPEQTSPLHIRRCARRNAFREAVEEEIQSVQDRFDFDSDLFKVVWVECGEGGGALVLIAHHIVLDGFSSRLIVRDFLSAYVACRASTSPVLPPKTTSLLDYTVGSARYWADRAEEESAYWRSLPWPSQVSLPLDFEPEATSLDERFSVAVSCRLPAPEARASAEVLRVSGRYTLTDVWLAAIAKAHHEWTGHEGLVIAVVFLGREILAPGLDLTRTVGYLSDTVPIVLTGAAPFNEILDQAHAQICRARARGKSFNFLRCRPQPRSSVAALPEATLSLNIKLSSFFVKALACDGGFEPSTYPYSRGEPNRAGTVRPFLLSGGLVATNDGVRLSWDFSSRSFRPSTIEAFGGACLAQFRRCLGREQQAC